MRMLFSKNEDSPIKGSLCSNDLSSQDVPISFNYCLKTNINSLAPHLELGKSRWATGDHCEHTFRCGL